MQNKFCCVWVFYISVLLTGVYAQENSGKILISNIKKSYDSFNYQETDRLLQTATEHLDKMEDSDKISVYLYSAFREFQKNRRFEARNNFMNIFGIDPTFNLDPVSVSPKIVALFRQTKIEYIEELDQRYESYQAKLTRQEKPWRSLLLPGWEQFHRGYDTKGYLFSAAALLSAAGLINAMVEADSRFDAYRDATEQADIDRKYVTYNQAYKNQFYWGYALASVWLLSHLDAVFYCPPKTVNFGLNVHSSPRLIFSVNF